jgi:hypothetical protein
MRILQVSTHTTLRPRHGGQLRSHHIGRIIEAAGFELKRLAVACKSIDDPVDPSEPIIDLSKSSIFRKMTRGGLWTLGDLFSLRAVLADRDLHEQFESVVRAADPDIIMLEHPWMWPALTRTCSTIAARAQVIYNSQNVETNLKRRMLRNRQSPEIETLLNEVETLEKDLVRCCAVTTVCTAADGDVFASWGAKRVLIANNGAVLPKRNQLIGMFPNPLTLNNKYALTVGSDHPPNLAGIQQFVIPALKFLRPFQRIVVAGQVCVPFSNWLVEQHLAALAKDRLVLMGLVGQTCLDSLIANASAILLPIPYGGGSNVKTAEALLAGHRIVATPQAMRGFREFLEFPGLTITDNEEQFCQAIMAAIEGGAAPPRDESLLASLLWENTLAPIVDLLRDMRRGRPSATFLPMGESAQQ